MRFNQLSLSLVAVVTVTSTSAAELSGDWILEKDGFLDGILAEETSSTPLTIKEKGGVFNLNVIDVPQGDFDVSLGELITLSQGGYSVVSFLDSQDSQKILYQGSSSDGVVYRGSWYSTNGTKGDFVLSSSLQSLPAKSCLEILQKGQANGDGIYTIYPVDDTALEVYCDMTTQGGGWTRIGNFNSISDIGGYTSAPQLVESPTQTGWHSAFDKVKASEIMLPPAIGTLNSPNATLKENLDAQNIEIVGNGSLKANTVYVNTEFRGSCSGVDDGLDGSGTWKSDFTKLFAGSSDSALSGSYCYDYFMHGDSWGRRDEISGPSYNYGGYMNWVNGVWIR